MQIYYIALQKTRKKQKIFSTAPAQICLLPGIIPASNSKGLYGPAAPAPPNHQVK